MSLKKKIFMLKKALRDLRRKDNYYTIADDLTSQTLGEYYFVFDELRIRDGKDQALITTTDENGIPLNKTYVDVEGKELVYFPISIGQMGLSVFHTYLNTGTDKDLDRYLKFAQWFMENCEHHPLVGVRWLTDVSLPAYRNPGPWQSAFAQSRGISILLRAFQITGEKKYADIAERALTSFQYPVSDGGVTSYTQWGPFYEEYTSEVPVLVLNGHIFALFGLYDFCRVFPENQLSRELFNSGVQTLLNALPDFDLGFWTRYNYCIADFYPDIDPATLTYQRLHIMQLKVINRIMQFDALETVILKWSNQINPFNYVKCQYLKYRALKQLGRL